MKPSKLNAAAALAAKKAADAKAALEVATAEALQAQTAADTKAAERRQAFMKKWLDEEFVQAHEADVALLASKAAFEAALEEAAQADPVLRAWLAHLRSSMRTTLDGQTATNFAQQVGVPAPVYFPNHGTSKFFEVMDTAMVRLASRLEGERQAEIFEVLERAANGDDDGT